MNKIQKDQKGFAHVFIVLIAVVLLGVGGYSAFRFVQNKNSNYTAENSEAKAVASKVKIKSMPIEIGTYDPVTKRAGDFLFPDQDLPEGVQQVLFSEFGYMEPGNSANNYKSDPSPQPTFIVAGGTKIKAMIDGEVIAVNKLYSDDYTIHMQGEGSDLIFELEHIIKPTVKVGDKVTAGTVVATASDYDAHNLFGMGVVEIGILKGGNPPTHICLFDYLDDSIKQDTFDKIEALKKSWEEYVGDTTLYDEANTVIPGCVNREPVTDNNNSETGKTNY